VTLYPVLGNAVQEWITGIVQTVPRAMLIRLWMITGQLVLRGILWPCFIYTDMACRSQTLSPSPS